MVGRGTSRASAGTLTAIPERRRPMEAPMKRVGLTMLAGTLCCGTALAAPVEERTRGEIVSVTPASFVVHTSGGNVTIALGKSTHYLEASRTSLDMIQPGSWIGTATKNIGATQVALEVGVFPPELRGFGDGHGPWDRLPDWTVSGATRVSSMMTNGSVAAVAAPPAGLVQTNMTNGSVSASASRGGARRLTVTYTGGQLTIVVPPTAPVVAFHPAGPAELAKGVLVTVDDSREGATRTANIVVAGVGGVRPPM